jgi:hypothetical protein
MKQLYGVVSASFTAALLTACGGGNSGLTSSTPVSVAPQIAPLYVPGKKGGKVTIAFTGHPGAFTVPNGVVWLTVEALAGPAETTTALPAVMAASALAARGAPWTA